MLSIKKKNEKSFMEPNIPDITQMQVVSSVREKDVYLAEKARQIHEAGKAIREASARGCWSVYDIYLYPEAADALRAAGYTVDKFLDCENYYKISWNRE